MPFEKYNVGCYILDRLVELGCSHMFGVPGDYNLRFLDDVMSHKIAWVGCANELNAAYAADGYARSRGLGAVLTTCGVGELSALNGIAGSSAEAVPVVHITGAPSTASRNNRELLHHTLGDGNYTHFEAISAQVCCSAVTLTPEDCTQQIDRVLIDVLFHKKPGYIALPMDVAQMSVNPPSAKLVRRNPEVSPDAVAAFKDAVIEKVGAARTPAVLVGHMLERFQLHAVADAFLSKTRIPFAVAALGKGAVNEQLPNFVGTYIAGPTVSPAKTVVEGADVCMLLGVELTDCVTAGFHHQILPANVIDLQPFHARVGSQQFQQVPMAESLRVLEEVCAKFHAKWSTDYPTPETYKPPRNPAKFDGAHLWGEIQSSLRPGDLLVVDLGSAAFSSLLLRLPEGVTFISQQLWASIGFAMPASFGAQIAEPDRRVICIAGDGAMQMVVQELGNFGRHKLSTSIVVINNNGYTIERFIRGTHAAYNDIAQWNWTGLAKDFCLTSPPETHVVHDVGEVEKLLKHHDPQRQHMLFIETVLGKMDGLLRTPLPLPVSADEVAQDEENTEQ